MNKKRLIFPSILLILVIIGLFNFQTLRDFCVSKIFSPSKEILVIESNLKLTNHGKTLFRASTPVLDSRADFNSHCSISDSEASVLGCFADGKIYIYNIQLEELPGVVESTAAHELLHAAWARLSDKEKANLTSTLEAVYESGSEAFKASLAPYSDEERLEEIYVRSATQEKNLPENLETHFATIFSDQDSLVDFYDSYISPFNELEKTLNELSNELSDLKQTIDSESSEYSSRSETLKSAVSEFNSCAATAGCFSNSTFNSRRAELVAEQSALNKLYDKLEADISAYNSKVAIYNEKVLYGQSLESLINSNSKQEETL